MIPSSDQKQESPLTRLFNRVRRAVPGATNDGSLKSKAFQGGAWLGAGSMAEQFARFGRNMILTRLLAPEAFGLMAIVLSAGYIVDTFTEIGIKEAIIQNPSGEEDRYVNAAWWVKLSRAFPLYVLIFFVSPWIAKFYGNPELTPLLRVAFLSILFYGLLSTGAYRALKQMKFRKWSAINNGGAICGVVMSIALSFHIRGVWVLVIGYCAEHASRCILSHVICPMRISFRVDFAAARDLLKFSRRVFGLTFFNFIFRRADIFVLARLISPAELGLYSMAVYLIQTPVGFLINIMNQVMMPSFTQLRDDDARTNRICRQLTSVIAYAGIPALVFAYFCGHPLLMLVYGKRYGDATGPLIAASFVALINLLNNPITALLFARGLPHIHRYCMGIMATVMIVTVYPFAKLYGPVGGQLACLAAVTCGYLFQVGRLKSLTGMDLSKYGVPFLAATGAALSTVVICLAVQKSMLVVRPIPVVVTGVAACLLAYGIAGTIHFKTLRRAESSN